MEEKKYVLKIESKIGGGSLSIFENEQIKYKREGFLIEQKADYLLEVLQETLLDVQIELESVKSIRYSAYHGSQTGLKILASIVKGLVLPYEISVVEQNIFKALIDFYKTVLKSEFLVILPLNQRESVLKYASDNEYAADEKIPTVNLHKVVERMFEKNLDTILPIKIFEKISKNSQNSMMSDYLFSLAESENVLDTGENLSIYL